MKHETDKAEQIGMIKLSLIVIAAIFILIWCQGCQTVVGLGRDLEWLGRNTEAAAVTVAQKTVEDYQR